VVGPRIVANWGVDEAADVLGISDWIVRCDWVLARSWVKRVLDAPMMDG